MSNSNPIDFVVTWVDDRDPVWRAKREQYTGKKITEGNEDARYRDWDTLKYWFRGVEKFAPWVRYVYFVTDDQKPEWLNLEHPKLKWVKHTDFIPLEYLPTFHSKVIEWNFYRISNLAEQFVYFNDDVFLINETHPEDFFVNDLPCDLPRANYIYPSGFWTSVAFNNTVLLNRHFSLRACMQANKRNWFKNQSLKAMFKNAFFGRKDLIPGMDYDHIHIPLKKSIFKTLWEKEYQSIHETCKHRQRTKNDVSIRCVQCWQLFSGLFYPKKPIGKSFHTVSMSRDNEAIEYLSKQKGKVICLNDTENEKEFALHKQMIVEQFEKIFPEKCSFEL